MKWDKENVSPAPSEAACTRVISATLTDEGSGISPADIRLTVGEAVYSIVDRELTHDAASGQVSFTSPGPIASDGATVACTLAAGDLAGNEMAPLEWSWTVDHAADTEPPPAPVVSYVPVEVMAANGFEDNVGEWGNFLSCQVRRLDSGGATGPGCIELTDLRDRSGSVYGMLEDFGEEWRRFPMLRFRYRGENARGGSMALMATAFNGSSEAWAQLGSLSVSDEWQTATVDLAKAVGANQDPHRLFLNLRVPNADGAVIIDDYAMYSRTAESAGLRWSAPSDASGVSGYSWALDSDNATVPPETITGTDTSTEFTGLEPGHYCFHIRARDNAGNWSATTHVPFEIE